MILLIGLISVVLTMISYYVAKALYAHYSIALFSPILIAPMALVTCLSTLHISYSSYSVGGKWLTLLLQPTIVAFALPLHKHYDTLRKHFLEITFSVLVGVLSALSTSAVLGLCADLNRQIIESLAPRSVTTPIAMEVSQRLGGVPPLTAVFVILTGLSGLILGPVLIRLLRIRTPIAKGVLLGTGAHGCGTSTALTIGPVEGTIASLAMIFTGLVTLILAPIMLPMLLKL